MTKRSGFSIVSISPVFILSFVVLLFFASGCTFGINVGEPGLSGFTYEQPVDSPVTITLVDNRKNSDLFFSGKSGFAENTISLANVEDELALIAEMLEKEMTARGVKATVRKVDQDVEGDIVLTVNRFHMQYYQPTGYNPFTVFTFFKAEASGMDTTIPLAFYYVTGRGTGMRVKTSISLTVTESFEALVKHTASLLSNRFLKLETDWKKIDTLIKKAAENDPPLCEDILEIAYTKSSRAVPFLTKLNSDIERGRLKSCAVAALGFHGDPTFLEFLGSFAKTHTRKERLTAMGAIGNIGTEKAFDLLRSMKNDEADSTYVRFSNDIIDLYTGE